MIKRGIPEHVIMKVGGWKTASVFRRYAIVDSDDLRDAARRMDQPPSDFCEPKNEHSRSFAQEEKQTEQKERPN